MKHDRLALISSEVLNWRNDMRIPTGGMLTLLLVTVLSFASATSAENMSAAQISSLEAAGVPVYPGSTYTTGDDEVATIMWFSSDDSPDQVLDWYADQLSDWSEVVVSGSRIIYKGPPGIESKDLSTVVYLWARTTDEDGVDADTEITVFIPK